MASKQMKKSLAIPILLQIILAVLGFWTLWGFPYKNGLLKHLGAQTEPGATIPGPVQAPMKQTYTNIAPIDRQLTVLVSFFYTAIDGNRGDISIAFLSLGSHVIAAWVLVTIEGHRPGNKGKFLLISTTILGLAVAIIGFAVVAPLYFAYHLHTSTTVHAPPLHRILPTDVLAVRLIPIGILLGFGLPSVIMTFPAPSVLSFDTKQLWTGMQQGWTFWILVSTSILTIVISIANPGTHIASTRDSRTRSINALRRAYTFAIISGCIAHILPLLICTLATFFPGLFAQPYATQLHLSNVFSLPNPFPPTTLKATTLADGALWFLQWDTFVGVVSVFVWSLALRLAAERDTGVTVVASLKILALTLVLGPTAVAVLTVWQRDMDAVAVDDAKEASVVAGNGKGGKGDDVQDKKTR